MVRKSKAFVGPARSIRARCEGNKHCERTANISNAATGLPLDIARDYYPEVRAWLIDEEQRLLAEGRTITAGYMRDNVTEHDRRYNWKEA